MLFCLLLIAAGAAGADEWVVWDYYNDPFGASHNPIEEGTSRFVASFADGRLSFSDTYAKTVGGSSASHWTLLFAGNWGVFGSVNEHGVLLPDPYATFVIEGPAAGYVVWAPETPFGYTASLLLGHRFVGDGAVTYYSNIDRPEVTGTLVLELGRQWYTYRAYTEREHVFEATYVPEPAGVLAMTTGLVGLWSVSLRRHRLRLPKP